MPPAGVPPRSGPEKFGKTEDVKETSSVSSAKESEPVEAPEESPDITEEDLQAIENQKTVPYNRFREVNEEKKALKKERENLLNRHQQELTTLAAQYEAKILAQQNAQSPYEVEYSEQEADTASAKALLKKIQMLEGKIGQIEGQGRQAQVRSDLSRLSAQYPEADTDAVLGWHKVYPEADLQDLMEKSHNDNLSRVNKRLANILEEKKKKQTRGLPVGGSSFRLKESERPKTFNDAAKMAKQFLNSQ